MSKNPSILLSLIAFSLLGLCAAPGPAEPFDPDSNEFPILMMDIHPADTSAIDDVLPVVKQMGVNYVHHYKHFEEAPVRPLETLIAHTADIDKAWEQYGLKWWVGLHRQRIKDHNLYELRTFVRAVKDKPGLGFWYLFDEPNLHHVWAEDLAPVYQMLKEETPEVPVGEILAGWRHWRSDNYLDYLDILMPDCYPVKAQPFPQAPIHETLQRNERALNTGKLVIPILQAFIYGSGSRFPNPTEIRFTLYGSLTQGVRGIGFYSYKQADRRDPTWMPQVFGPVLAQASEFIDIVRPAHQPIKLMEARKQNVYAALWPRESGTYLVLCHARSSEKDLKISLEGHLDNARLQPWGGMGEAAEVKDGTLELTVGPWATLVWRVLP